ncbi:hypothetical protein ABPG72_006827 [Tetrahymena utriculariae]
MEKELSPDGELSEKKLLKLCISKKKESRRESKRNQDLSSAFNQNRKLLQNLFSSQKETRQEELMEECELQEESESNQYSDKSDIDSDGEQTEQKLKRKIQKLSNSDEDQRPAVELAIKLKLPINPICDECNKQMGLVVSSCHLNQLCWRCYSRQYSQRRYHLYKNNRLFQSTRLKMSFLPKLHLLYMSYQESFTVISHSLPISKYDLTQIRQNKQVVEIDESVFQRKYQRGRYLRNQQWLLGITERNNKQQRTILLPIQKRDSDTFIPLIKQFVSPNSVLVCTNKWKGYNSLKRHDYRHKSVNHSENFVTPAAQNKLKKKKKKQTKKLQSYEWSYHQHTNNRKQVETPERKVNTFERQTKKLSV